jgi:hypothetical protein
MSTVRIVALILIISGILGLVYDEFTYTKETHDVVLGPIEAKVKEKETMAIPKWASVGAIAVGVFLLLKDRKR